MTERMTVLIPLPTCKAFNLATVEFIHYNSEVLRGMNIRDFLDSKTQQPVPGYCVLFTGIDKNEKDIAQKHGEDKVVGRPTIIVQKDRTELVKYLAEHIPDYRVASK